MRTRQVAFAALAAGVSGALLLFCVGDDSSGSPDAASDGTADGQNNGDAASNGDADAGPPAQGFTLSVTPSHVTTDPGDTNIAVVINVNRAASFSDDVSFTIATPPLHVTATTPADTGNGGGSSSFSVNIDPSATPADVSLTITGQNPTKTFVANASLGIRVGTLVDIGDGGFVVPSYANALIVKAWGAGGGGGAGCSGCTSGQGSGTGGPGGGGGFASATVPVTPNASIVAIVGTGGAGGGFACSDWGGGGGGGLSALRVQGGSYLIIAGGGGGGTSTYFSAGIGGGAGGGLAGENGGGTCTAYGGTQTQGGTTADAGLCMSVGKNGAAYQGGDGYVLSCASVAAGGSPGGGKGGADNTGAGGGGAGYFGGAGGTSYFYPSSGAGGSGWLGVDAGTLATGSGATAANTNDIDFAECAANAGAGGLAGAFDGGVGGPGGGGCLVVRLPKP